MCRAGGPRCNGRGRRNVQVSEGTAVAERPPEPAKSTVPSREETDRLAAEYKGGRPLRAPDRRLHALRAAGYRGKVDQDGYPVEKAPKRKATRKPANSTPTAEELKRLQDVTRQLNFINNLQLGGFGQ